MNKLFWVIAASSLLVTGHAKAFDTTTTGFTTTTDQPISNSDQDIAKKVKDTIGPGFFSKGYEQVTVKVSNGDVTLQGAVPTMEDKAKIEKSVRDINGVRNLNSELVVQNYTDADAKKVNQFPQDVSATPEDFQLNKKIRDNVSAGFLWNSYTGVTLNTNNGIVTLQGVIDNPSDQQKLIQAIQKIEGVKSINSNLTVKNK